MLALYDDYTILIHKNVRDHSPANGLIIYQNRLIFLLENEKCKGTRAVGHRYALSLGHFRSKTDTIANKDLHSFG